jgi:SNF2 family DNA or RNA helicase
LQNSDAPSGKLQVLTAHLHELSGEGRKSLVFSQFTSLLDLVGDELDAQSINWVRLDGSTRDRAQVVERFQTDPSVSVFLISLKAGGTGLNLTAADCVFILDPWWNPASEAQASARAHRIGQKRSVFVQRIISRGTVEEAIMELKGKKQELSDALIQGGAGATSLNRDDLLALLQPDLS